MPMVVSSENSKLWLPNIVLVSFVHLISLWTVITCRPSWLSVVFVVLTWQLAGLGITVGYHRLWSHRSFKASLLVRIMLAFLGTLAFQGSIKWWAKRHRLHHRYVDTDNDPYNSRRGFWFSHIGWIFNRPRYTKSSSIDISDLSADLVVEFQHKHYPILAVLCGFGLPYLLCQFLKDQFDGFMYCAFVAKVFIWHSTFCINSFAHMLGNQNYSIEKSARGNLLLAFLTAGEGHHNFHHEFPSDYRNGISALDYDPSKWLIWLLNLIGMASNLKRTDSMEIEMAFIDTAQKKIEKEKAKYNWGPEKKDLPEWTLEKIGQSLSEGRKIIIIDGIAHDVTHFMSSHPGGSKIIDRFVGRDATAPFNGGSNIHSMSAKRLAKLTWVAKV